MNLVYKYGLLEPTQSAELVDDQMSSAHRYQNKLVELERSRRKAIEALVVTPEIVAAYAKAKAAKSACLTEEETDALWAEYRALSKKLYSEHAAEIAVINEKAKADKRAARNETQTYWGTYLQIEKASEAASKDAFKESGREAPDNPVYPKFRRWKREGGIAVQIQNGMSVSELHSGQDTRLNLTLACLPVPNRNGKALPRLHVRVGSDEHKDPIWAVWPIIFHRPLPETAIIKEAKVVRRMIAAQAKWSVVITLALPNRTEAAPALNCVALDIGWRRTEIDPKSATRSGEWWDGKAGEELILADDIIAGLTKADSLRSIRAKHRLTVQSTLIDWINKVGKPNMPEEFVERIRYLALWQAEAQFAGLCLWWRDHRFTNDTEMFERLESWRKKDKHLWLWEANQRNGSLDQRLDYYRCVAAKLSKVYDGLIIENLNLAKLSEKTKPDDPGQHQSRSQKQNTAPSHLRTAVVNAFKRDGKPVFIVSATKGAKALYELWREGKGKLAEATPARSKRFKRLRKIVDPPDQKIDGSQAPPA